MDKSRLIFEPKVHIIAQTQMTADGLGDWVDDHGLKEVLGEDTPLGDIYDATMSDSSAEILPEFAGRFCYRSFEKGRDHEKYIENILDMKHGSVLEHSSVSFAISGVSRSLSHELVRHRAGVAISQESQRYVDANDMKFVVPVAEAQWLKDSEIAERTWLGRCSVWLADYKSAQGRIEHILELQGLEGTMLKKRVNEAAREYLPNAAETRLVWTLNFRALRHVLELRGGIGADLQFQRLTRMMAEVTCDAFPTVFGDFRYDAETGVTCKHSKV